MADWTRLGTYVTARRDELGYRTRQQLADASNISTRILGDIETGRRDGRFDRTTIARLERTLKWATGSAQQIADGGEPTLLAGPDLTTDRTSANRSDTLSALVTKIMRDDRITEAQKTRIVQILIKTAEDERRRAEQRLNERADELIELLSED
ncbi:hypothetical protein ACQP2Y_21985 [Actinoplanes sp. CA-051413]|uniref:hypothetical protein n=1 Tax=Actinoplanes sp. CA-051413 TaxID=3239899 RepID=UPI003D990668